MNGKYEMLFIKWRFLFKQICIFALYLVKIHSHNPKSETKDCTIPDFNGHSCLFIKKKKILFRNEETLDHLEYIFILLESGEQE